MTVPKVSVIIPAYNVAPYISETLASVFSQTYHDYEVVIVNDGSTDTGELETLLEPHLSRINYIKQDNQGAGAARNRAVRAARGEFVAFLDADDFWLPQYLEEQVRFITSGDYDLVYADALLFGDSPLAGRTFMDVTPSTGDVTFLSLITHRSCIVTSGVLARREKVLEVGLFDETLRNSQDFDLWVRLVRYGARANYQQKVLLRYRCRTNSLSGDEVNRLARQIRVYEKIDNSYDLADEEHQALNQVLNKVKALHQLEIGKLELSKGKYEEARQALKRSDKYDRNWKLRGILLLLRVAPQLLRHLHTRRNFSN